MKHMNQILAIFLAAVCVVSLVSVLAADCSKVYAADSEKKQNTFCNPMDLNYGLSGVGKDTVHREGADPVVVLFKDNYYLFSTWDRGGYRKSHNLIDWTYIPFTDNSKSENNGFSAGSTYTAAAVEVIGDYMYFLDYRHDGKAPHLIRTADPDSGEWTCVKVMPRMYHDPDLFYDEDTGRLFLYHGLGSGIFVQELDSVSFELIGENKQIALGNNTTANGNGYNTYQFPGWNWNTVHGQTYDDFNYPVKLCREGSGMTKVGNKYYLDVATPGTVGYSYADATYVSDSPMGPFTLSMHGPTSEKPTGFIRSAGHSNIFQDRYGNYWKVASMWIGIHATMERRVGLFPVGFDVNGNPYTVTGLGDTPIYIPQEKVDDPYSLLMINRAGWANLTDSTKVSASASSYAEGTVCTDVHISRDETPETDTPYIVREPKYAVDNSIYTWWSAQSGDAGEYLLVDLGRECSIKAFQVNFDEDGMTTKPENDIYRYKVTVSSDNLSYKTLYDASANTREGVHPYIELPEAVSGRYVKIENVSCPADANFAIYDFRIFGTEETEKPEEVTGISAVLSEKDCRSARITFNPSEGAERYIIRYGISPDAMHRSYEISASQTTVDLFILGFRAPVYFTVDAVNGAGKTEGTQIVKAEIPQNAFTPFKSISVPGTFAAVDFDDGIKTYAYNGLSTDGVNVSIAVDENGFSVEDTVNAGGAYRDTCMDIYEVEDRTVLRLKYDEWVRYSVNVEKSGNYDITIAANGYEKDSALHIEDACGNRLFEGKEIAISDEIREYTIKNVYLDAGENALYLVCDYGRLDVDKISLDYSAEALGEITKDFENMTVTEGNSFSYTSTRGKAGLVKLSLEVKGNGTFAVEGNDKSYSYAEVSVNSDEYTTQEQKLYFDATDVITFTGIEGTVEIASVSLENVVELVGKDEILKVPEEPLRVVRSCIGASGLKNHSGITVAEVNSTSPVGFMVFAEKDETFRVCITYASEEEAVIALRDENGTMISEEVTLPDTKGFLKNATFSINQAGGAHLIKLEVLNGELDFAKMVTLSEPIPFNNTPQNVPGSLELNAFDEGGEGVAYHDNDSTNSGGAGDRAEGVDIAESATAPNGLKIGWGNGGEWIKYTVDAEKSGWYILDVYAGVVAKNVSMRIEDAFGNVIVDSFGFAESGGYNAPAHNYVPIYLDKGLTTLKFVRETAYFDIHGLSFEYGELNFKSFTIGGAEATVDEENGIISVTVPESESPVAEYELWQKDAVLDIEQGAIVSDGQVITYTCNGTEKTYKIDLSMPPAEILVHGETLEGYTEGSINGQGNWKVTKGTADVVAGAQGHSGNVVKVYKDQDEAKLTLDSEKQLEAPFKVSAKFWHPGEAADGITYGVTYTNGKQDFIGSYVGATNTKQYQLRLEVTGSRTSVSKSGVALTEGWHEFAVVADADGVITYYVDGTLLTNNGAQLTQQLPQGVKVNGFAIRAACWGHTNCVGYATDINYYKYVERSFSSFRIGGAAAEVDYLENTISATVSSLSDKKVSYALCDGDATVDIIQGQILSDGQKIVYKNGDVEKTFTVKLNIVPFTGITIPENALLSHRETLDEYSLGSIHGQGNWKVATGTTGTVVNGGKTMGYPGKVLEVAPKDKNVDYTLSEKLSAPFLVTMKFYQPEGVVTTDATYQIVYDNGKTDFLAANIGAAGYGSKGYDFRINVTGTRVEYLNTSATKSAGWHEFAVWADENGVITYYVDGKAVEKNGSIITAQLPEGVKLSGVRGTVAGWGDKNWNTTGSKATANTGYLTDIAFYTIKPTIKGDADGNGSVTVYDAVHVLKAVAGIVDESSVKAADIDGDGTVTVADAIRILKYIARITDTI